MAGMTTAPSRCWTRVGSLLCSGLLLALARQNPLDPLIRADAERSSPLDARSVAVVINSEDPLSEAIGTHYQRVRRIPPNQVLRVRFPPQRASLDPGRFQAIRRKLLRDTPSRVQVYALAWAAPYRVGCQSITSAFSQGLHPAWCADGCQVTRISPYFARGEVARPWDDLRIRPSMLLAASNEAAGRALIDRGALADGSAPHANVYLLSTSDYKRNSRLPAFERAVRLSRPDLRVHLLQQDALEGASDVLGYFTGLASVPAINTNHFLPGAVADHLTSLGGQLTDSPQMSALRWLEAGATASYGTVVEPCNFPSKFPDPGLLLNYYRRGDTLIEAYWRSVAMPGQGVFIGEPLARPWPERKGSGLKRNAAAGASSRRVR
ncbi:MAG: TIGR03790 family protein [Cyanobacteria bacterium]|nr:TIGR03790 family protein [Cyanobacteriota bacterium]